MLALVGILSSPGHLGTWLPLYINFVVLWKCGQLTDWVLTHTPLRNNCVVCPWKSYDRFDWNARWI